MSVRNNPFTRATSSSPGPSRNSRPKSGSLLYTFSNPLFPPSNVAAPSSNAGNQTQSTGLAPALVPVATSRRHSRSDFRNATPMSNTFAPSFIKSEEMQRGIDAVKGIEGENDFSGKRYVWLKDPEVAFVKGWIVEERADNRILVQCDDGTVSNRLSILMPTRKKQTK